MRCPNCKQDVAADGPFRPFCSERCKLVDLGRWLDGGYAVPDEAADDDDLAAELERVELERRRH